MRFLFGFVLLASILTACSTSVEEEVVDLMSSEKQSTKEKIELCLQDEYVSVLRLNETQKEWLRNLYKDRNYKALWIKDSTYTTEGEELKFVLDRSMWLGIPTNRIHFAVNKEKNIIIEELMLTARSAVVLQDLKFGMIEDTIAKYKPAHPVDRKIFDQFTKNKDVVNYTYFMMENSCLDTNYRFMAKHLYSYCSSYPMDEKEFKIKPMKEDSIAAIRETKNALESKGYLKKEATEEEFNDVLKTFQEHNGLKPDGKIGKYTVRALNESTYTKVLRAGLTLDKLRRKEKYPEKFIQINLPEYLLRLVVKDSLKSIHHIVIGKETNTTPQLKSRIYEVVVYPYWNVPYSIMSKEILPAAKNNVNYFARNNYKIYRKDVEIDPHSVNWKKIKENSFPYKVIQQPGPKNSLGIIKFEFHNKYSVYVHDSPQKSLFKTDVRSYSHGCMRCERPVDLGKLLLDYDSVGRKGNALIGDSLDSLLTIGENFPIRLLKPVPIFVEYQTVSADKDRMIFHIDIYKRDEEYLKIMKE